MADSAGRRAGFLSWCVVSRKELALQDALALHRTSSISEAAAIYRQIIAHHPDNAAALHLLGSPNCNQAILPRRSN
jgi:hypothetical protein